MISFNRIVCSTAAMMAAVMAGVSLADDGIVKISDRGNVSGSGIQQAAFHSGPCGDTCYIPQSLNPECCPDPCPSICCPCPTGACNGAVCYAGMYCDPSDCNNCFQGSYGYGVHGCDPCQGRHGRHGHQCCNPKPKGLWQKCARANNTVCDRLFGWMIPSGCGGQGAPLAGKYHMVYAEQPSWIDPRDTQIYAAQGYGMPMTVPLAPNVNHAYNYSSGIPASRVTTIGNYNPATSARPLPHQSW